MLDLLIKNCQVVDGSGKPAYQADVAVVGERIVQIAPKIEQEAARVIDATGLTLAPGFIDAHTHSDVPLLIDNRAHSRVYQGVTTDVMCNCGSSPAPLLGAAREDFDREYGPAGLEADWTDMAGYLSRLQRPGIGINVVALVGHNQVRASVIGYDDVQPTSEQQKQMEKLVAESMEQGAHGMSSGLYYPPGIFAKTEEVIGLAKVVARYGGIYSTHIRSESDGLFDAVREALEIGEKAQIRVEISHLKLEGYHNYGGYNQLMELIDDANRRGLVVGCDQYPYAASSTWMGSILPYWAQAGGGAVIGERLKDPQVRAKIRKEYVENRVDWDNRAGASQWDEILIVESFEHPEWIGKNVLELAETQGKDPLDCAMDMMSVSGGGPSCVFFDQLEDNVRRIIQHPAVVTGSDGAAMSPEGILGAMKGHPRSYGTFPRVLGKYVREEKILTLETAVRKMTSMTAERFGIKERGMIREGYFADLVLFDAAKIIDRATFTDPQQYPAGIPYVFVNGKCTVDQSVYSGALAGKVL